MIGRLYDGYVERLAADAGVWAFFKWSSRGFALQYVLLVPALLLLSTAAGRQTQIDAGVAALIASFLAARACLFAFPCGAVARRKNLGSRRTWSVCGFLFGPFALGLAASRRARPPEGAI